LFFGFTVSSQLSVDHLNAETRFQVEN
jgi:hypothetical protein